MKYDEAYIIAYLKKDLTDREIREFKLVLQSSAELKEKMDEIQSVYNLAQNLTQQKKINTSSAWNKLSGKIDRQFARIKLWNIARNAAAVLLPLLFIFEYAVKPSLEAKHAELITISSAPGIITKTTLPDGSEVWLNAQSSLVYPDKFTRKERTVQLSGEAFFKVKSDKKHRFNVVTPDKMTVSAYGTQFNVAAYPNEQKYQITLAEGHVDVASQKTNKVRNLSVNQKILLDAQSGEMFVTPADTYVETAWKDGKMVFRREKLETITQKLSRKFGVNISLEDEEIRNYEFTATFTDETIEDILELLKKSSPLSYSVSNQKKLGDNTFSLKTIRISTKNKSK